MKKVIILSLVLLMTLATITNVYAVSKFEIALKPSKSEASKNEEVTVEVNISKIGFEEGIVALGGTLDYDKDSLELVKFEAGENWAKPSYYENSKKFATDRSGYGKDDETVFKIVFKVKDDANEDANIKLSEVSGSDGEDEITLDDITAKITIKNGTSKPDDQKPDDQKPDTNTSKDDTNTNTNKNDNTNTNTNNDSDNKNNNTQNTNSNRDDKNTNTNQNTNTNANNNTNKINNSSKNTNALNELDNVKGGILPKAGTTSVVFAILGIMIIVAGSFYARIRIIENKSKH